jgi:D-lactate dehydrogenase (cytochrome)
MVVGPGTKLGIEAAIEILSVSMPGRVATGEAVRRQHANSLTWIACEPPDAVAWPETPQEVAEVVRLAAEYRFPLVPFGAGTSLEGHVNAPFGGLSVDLSRMSRIIAIHPGDFDAEVEAGVTKDALNAHLRDTGLFFAVDPGAGGATLGGMAATRASGTTTTRYGSMRDNVLSLTAVMAGGVIVSTGGRAPKSAAGYDLTRLMVGAEGTLGIITSLRLRLHPVPASVMAACIPFATLEGASEAAIAALQAGLAPARVELLDKEQMRAVNRYSALGQLEAPTLFVEVHGLSGATAEAMNGIREIAMDHGALSFTAAAGEEERRRIWRARHDAFWAVKALRPGRIALVTDVCVPISRLAECIVETAADIRSCGLEAPIVGHVGDGNFHAIPLVDPSNEEEMRVVRGFLDRLVDRALAMQGTSTGEHGVGQGKIAALEKEAGPGVDVMRALKRALDPEGIFNPGKLFRSLER